MWKIRQMVPWGQRGLENIPIHIGYNHFLYEVFSVNSEAQRDFQTDNRRDESFPVRIQQKRN